MLSATFKNGEPYSPAKVHPLLSPQTNSSFSDLNPVDADASFNNPARPESPQPPQTSVHCPQDAPYNASVATTEIGGAPAVTQQLASQTSDESTRNQDPTGISTSSSIENLSVLPRVPSFGENRTRKHLKNACSIDSAIPRQTILKALQSRPPPTSQSMDTVVMDSAGDERKSARSKSITHSQLAKAISELELHSADLSASRMAALASPCFFHKKFDKAVNLGKVMEEMSEDDTISHSRLMQTASSVREVSKQLQRRPIKMTVRNVMIVTKARDNNLVYLTRELAEWLMTTSRYGSDVGVNVYVDHKLRKSKRFDAASLLAKDPRYENMLRWWTPDLCWETPEIFDLVLTLGGDGTVLFTSWLFQRIVPPILSFSLGSLGFLTNFEFAQYRPALDKIMCETGMRVNLRMRFTCTVYRYQKNAAQGSPQHIEAEQFEVLNELVIDRGPSPYVSNLELYGDNNLLTVVQADGCIFSTPTGSTAYSLSAGGSLVHPDIPAILLTPICPHTLSFRPMLLNDSMLLRIAVPLKSRATAYCAFDGKGRVELRQGDHVTIAASQYPFPTVLSQPTEWFDSISRTLRWNSRGATQKAWDGDEDDKEAEEEKEPDFDIDFDNDDVDRDSGYSAEGSTVDGRGSPMRKGVVLPFFHEPGREDRYLLFSDA
ncbi:ATP-NAD kinase [Stemphylium lycopersici]|uniref:ATP-NAD kinase n=1 Tax=Stemphylium lycopersici TaxID=183478 RepID=A0A364N5U9_STELY|nr:nad kinase atp nad kinase [Stemphylium lycopersici]RAR00510.1 ATP-NAD kinase [Stemphylium lycopersici]RAR12704.1 ATP-NAD kinase [Stemphylium lycopersici]